MNLPMKQGDGGALHFASESTGVCSGARVRIWHRASLVSCRLSASCGCGTRGIRGRAARLILLGRGLFALAKEKGPADRGARAEDAECRRLLGLRNR